MSEHLYRQLQETRPDNITHYSFEPVSLSELLWVDCQIEMPPENAVVVIDIDEDGDVWTGYWREEGGEVRWYGDNDGALLTVTNWQRRVDPPEAKEQKPEYDKEYFEKKHPASIIPIEVLTDEETRYQKFIERARAEGKI